LVYGSDGKKDVRDWWKRWRAEMRGGNEGLPSSD
jgi:hypothetical protein